jgi:SET domain-containing protein
MAPRYLASLAVGPCPLGQGLFATRRFGVGEMILRLSGRRYEREDPIHSTPSGANLLQTGRRTYIMLEPPGVFANHSCDPNAGIAGNRRLVAIRPIADGDEIRFDYSTTMAEDLWTMVCRCGAPGCRGVVTDFRLLPSDIKSRYLHLGVVQRFIASTERRREVSC